MGRNINTPKVLPAKIATIGSIDDIIANVMAKIWVPEDTKGKLFTFLTTLIKF